MLWWNNAAATNQNFVIDFYNAAHVLIGSSQSFTVPIPAPTTFMTLVLASDIPFSGPFYAMLHWNMFTGNTHWLGMDQNGPTSSQNLGYYYDGTTWSTIASLGYPGNFCERVCALVFGDKMTFEPGPAPAPSLMKASVPAGALSAAPATEGVSIDSHNYATMSPDAPNAGTGLIGYNVYRNNIFALYVPGPDSLRTYDYNLDPGHYCYDVRAKYDLSVYGLPAGTTGLSLNEKPGPVCIDIHYGFKLPFLEPWDMGNFGFQGWTFQPTQGNWSVNAAFGNPAPSANFTWQPIAANYNLSLISPNLDASAWTCAKIWLDLDYKLDDRNATGTEKMDVDVQYDNVWHQKAELTNTGSVNWTPLHLDCSGAKGKGLKVRFRANGPNSQNILNWFIDNIHVYGVCINPTELVKQSQSHDTIHLTWTAPKCGTAGVLMDFIFDDGSAENGWAINPGYNVWLGTEFPINATINGVFKSFKMYWWNNAAHTAQQLTLDVFDNTRTLIGSSNPFTPTNDDWLIIPVNDIPFTGAFYGMVHWNMATGATNYLGDDENGPYSPQDLGWYYDGAAWTKMSVEVGGPPCVFMVRATALVFGDKKTVELIPGAEPTGLPSNSAGKLAKADNSQNVSRETYDHSVMGPKETLADSSQLQGYNVWRTDPGANGVPPYSKLNTSPVNGTTYQDVLGLDVTNYGIYKYFVTAVFNDSETNALLCESTGSDTIQNQFPAVGVENITNGSVIVYPNPANEVVNVKSDYNISRADVLNFIGQTVYTQISSDTKLLSISTTTLEAGVYFLRINTSVGIRTVKITIVR